MSYKTATPYVAEYLLVIKITATKVKRVERLHVIHRVTVCSRIPNRDQNNGYKGVFKRVEGCISYKTATPYVAEYLIGIKITATNG